MHKLQSLGVESYLLKWIHSYLANRRQCVVLDGAKSSVLPVSSGVPQGSVLGPLLFIIYIDGVQGATVSNSTVVLYADDMVLYKTIQSQEDYSLIQTDINAVATWIENRSLMFNQEKCKLMLFSRKGTAQLPTIKLNGCSLERVSEFKYLGVHLTSDLSWSTRVTKVCSKARKCLGMLYRKILIHSDMYTCRVLYTTFLRPHLEYACQVWDPHLLKDIEALEGVQKFALRACCKNWTTPYDTLLTQFDIPSLQSRRRYFKLCLLFKIINKLVDFPYCPITFRESKYNIRNVH